MDGGQVSGSLSEVDFSTGGTVQSLVRPQVSVVVKAELESMFKLSLG